MFLIHLVKFSCFFSVVSGRGCIQCRPLICENLVVGLQIPCQWVYGTENWFTNLQSKTNVWQVLVDVVRIWSLLQMRILSDHDWYEFQDMSLKKHLTKIRKKIKNWHFGETSFGRPEIFLEVIRNHHVSTSNFSAICPSKRRELVRLRRDLPEHQSRGPQSCVFFWGWSGLVEFCFCWGIKKHRNIRWTWRNCFTSRVMVSKLIMSWYDNSPPCFSFGGQYSILKSLISTCVLSYIGSREYWLLDRSQRVKKTH